VTSVVNMDLPYLVGSLGLPIPLMVTAGVLVLVGWVLLPKDRDAPFLVQAILGVGFLLGLLGIAGVFSNLNLLP
jgi:hypothetical protein